MPGWVERMIFCRKNFPCSYYSANNVHSMGRETACYQGLECFLLLCPEGISEFLRKRYKILDHRSADELTRPRLDVRSLEILKAKSTGGFLTRLQVRIQGKAGSSEVDWTRSEPTLLLAVSKGCRYCTESAPFYGRLVRPCPQECSAYSCVAARPVPTSLVTR